MNMWTLSVTSELALLGPIVYNPPSNKMIVTEIHKVNSAAKITMSQECKVARHLT